MSAEETLHVVVIPLLAILAGAVVILLGARSLLRRIWPPITPIELRQEWIAPEVRGVPKWRYGSDAERAAPLRLGPPRGPRKH